MSDIVVPTPEEEEIGVMRLSNRYQLMFYIDPKLDLWSLPEVWRENDEEIET